MNKKITISDIASKAGVAKSTVSRYLNHGYVSKEKAAIIDKVIQETGYKSNFFAKRLKTKHSKLIGIVMPRLDSYTAGKLFMGFNKVLEAQNYQILMLVSNLNIHKEIANIRQLIQQGVDGIIVQSIGITKEHLAIVKQANIPIMFTGQSHPEVIYAKINDKHAGLILGEYIAHLHHQNVVYVGVSLDDVAVGIKRKQGFYEGFLAHNPSGKIHFVQTDFSFDRAYACGNEIMQFSPTAIVCATDNIALGVLRYLHEQKIQVPQDVSLTGFGGYPLSSVSYPSLTTVSFDYERLGIITAQKILALLKGQDVSSEFDDNLSLITRESTQKLSN